MANAKYVILHGGVGQWKRGDVVTEEWFAEHRADIKRLLTLSAMRAATEEECRFDHVDLEDNRSTAKLSYQQQLAEKDKKIADLTARVMELEEEKSGRVALAHASAHREMAGVVEAKDKTIHDLSAQLQQAQGRVKQQTHQAPPTPAAVAVRPPAVTPG